MYLIWSLSQIFVTSGHITYQCTSFWKAGDASNFYHPSGGRHKSPLFQQNAVFPLLQRKGSSVSLLSPLHLTVALTFQSRLCTGSDEINYISRAGVDFRVCDTLVKEKLNLEPFLPTAITRHGYIYLHTMWIFLQDAASSHAVA